jgi:hypothetical protein
LAHVRHARDKGRVVPNVRDDCFAGERLDSFLEAHERAERWCRQEYGLRRHTMAKDFYGRRMLSV